MYISYDYYQVELCKDWNNKKYPVCVGVEDIIGNSGCCLTPLILNYLDSLNTNVGNEFVLRNH